MIFIGQKVITDKNIWNKIQLNYPYHHWGKPPLIIDDGVLIKNQINISNKIIQLQNAMNKKKQKIKTSKKHANG